VLDPQETTLIVPDRTSAESVRSKYTAGKQAKYRTLMRSFGPFPDIEFPWHIIALEDLGYWQE
jgi:hypothetical protein